MRKGSLLLSIAPQSADQIGQKNFALWKGRRGFQLASGFYWPNGRPSNVQVPPLIQRRSTPEQWILLKDPDL